MTTSGKMKWSIVTSVVAILSLGVTAQAVPVVPNFTQGSMTSHTETTSKITETINSMDYNTGYQYSATGTGVTASGSLSPGTGSYLLYTSPSPRDLSTSRMPSSA